MAAAAAAAVAGASAALVSNPNFPSSHKHSPNLSFISSFSNIRMPTTCLIKSTYKHFSSPLPLTPIRATSTSSPTTSPTPATTFHGLCYVLRDNIDTDQIIPAEHLTLVPSNPDEYRKLGSFALIGLPSTYPTRFIEPGEFQSKYSIVIGGENFGCGSSREHAPVALGASGVKAVVAESYARIFFRNSIATGEVYPLESEGRLCDECSTGDVVTIELAESVLTNHTTGKVYDLKPIGDAGPVIEAGGIFAYARKTGLIPSQAPSS